jgi:bifunctional non-homologous end joining protein LigD
MFPEPNSRPEIESRHWALLMRAQFIEPMLATLVEQPPEGDDCIHEIRHNGYRSQLVIQTWEGAGVHAARRRLDREISFRREGSRFAAGKFGDHRCEITVLTAEGRSDYGPSRNDQGQSALAFIAFDLLMIDGKDVRGETTPERRERLQILLDDHPPHEIFGGGARQREGLLRSRQRNGTGGHRIEASKSRLYRAWLRSRATKLPNSRSPTCSRARQADHGADVDRENKYLGGAFITNRRIRKKGFWRASGDGWAASLRNGDEA